MSWTEIEIIAVNTLLHAHLRDKQAAFIKTLFTVKSVTFDF